jgi:glycerol-3-phosphate dehydrogenase
MFVVPWGQWSYIGATHTACADAPEQVYANAEDVVYLLRSVNALYPDARLTAADIVATWAGLRPLLAPPDPLDPSSVPPIHRVVEGAGGLISVVGGTLTTHLVMAREAVDLVAARLHDLDGRAVAAAPPTDREPLPGGEAHDMGVVADEVERDGFSRATADHLVDAYGSETPAVTRLALSDPALAEPLAPGHPGLLAELVHAMRREMAVTLGDLLVRRTQLFYEASDNGLAQLERVADLATREMGWDADRRAAELAAYRHEAERSMAFKHGLTEPQA